MFSKRKMRLQAVFVILLSLVALGARGAMASRPDPVFTPGSGQVLAASSPSERNETPNPQGPGERRGYSDETGKLNFIGFAPTQAREVPGSVRGSWGPQDHAMASLILYGPELGVRNPLRDMKLQRVQTTDGGREHSRYQQTYEGVPVLGGELAVNTTSRGQLLSISGEVSPDLSLSTQPQISAEQARETALGIIAMVYDLSAADLEATEPELWIFDERLLRPSTRPAEMVWRMDVSARDAALPIRELVLINAETGGVSLHFNQIDTAWVSAPPADAQAAPEPAPLQATITVSTTADDNTVNGNCTLREAIIAANTDTAVDACPAGSGDDVIDLPAGTYVLSILGTGEDAAATGDLDITSNLSITGAGSANTILDGDSTDRIFDIVAGGHVVSISNLTIRNGNPNSLTAGIGSGAAIRNRGSLTVSTSLLTDNYTWVEGGAIGSLSGNVTVNNTVISGNRASYGGGIYLINGLLTLNNTTVSGNEAGEQGGDGGGILTSTSSTLIVNNSTISNNTAARRGGGIAIVDGLAEFKNSTISGNVSNGDGYNGGGGISHTTSSLLRIVNCTIAYNHALSEGGGIRTVGGTVRLRNTIVADNESLVSGPDCTGTIDSEGYNLVGSDWGCDLVSSSGDIIGTRIKPVAPVLDHLRDNGGPTFTHALLVGSPAIDAGNPDAPGSGGNACESTDQRGVTRPVGGACDIGSFEGSAGNAIQTYTAGNEDILPGVFLCDETMPDCTSGADLHADAAHHYAIDTDAFYAAQHGRYSIDDAGMVILSTVHYATNYANAFWNGSRVVYGDKHGYPLADDVVAHELTHGVTQHSSGLFYYYQSGAINESLSDLWGEFVDLTNGAGRDGASYRWLVGEDVSGMGAIRDMAHPPAYGDPDRMGSSLYYTGSADFGYFGDDGGVHTNSGVNNKAVYLMTDGDTFNGETVTGLGIDKVAAIYYEVQTNLLTSGSDYADLYHALYQACLHVVGGVEGVTEADCQEVRDATDAVEMDHALAQGYNPQAAVCPGDETPFNLFHDDLESGEGNWTLDALTGTSSWVWASGYATSGTNMLWGNDYYEQSDSYAAMNLDVTLPAGSQPYLHFNHAFGFEDPNYDGGFLEVSTDGGGSWSDARTLFDDGLTYSSRIRSSSGKGSNNPNADHYAFIGDSHGYVSSRYDLSSLAGDDVRFRWRISTDPLWYDWGWFVDDVRIYTCGTDDVPPTDPDPASLVSTSHTVGIPSTDNVIVMEWGDGADDVGGSGLAGYSVLFDDQPTSQPDSTVDVAAGASSPNTVSSSPRADGTWYFHLSTCDVAGNCTNTLHAGPYVVDRTPPLVSNVDSMEDSGDGSLDEDEQTRARITQLLVTFNEEVQDGSGPEGAENLASYSLVADPGGASTPISIDSADYDPGTSTTTLGINAGSRLLPGTYRLTVAAAIEDLIGLPLDGDGDGTGGDDFTRDFTVLPPCYSLTTALSDEAAGSLSVSPGPNCDGTLYTENTVVTLEAIPNPDYVFDQWSGDASGSANPLDVMMDGHKDITVNFLACYTLSTLAAPSSGGTVSADVAPNCLGTHYLAGTAVELTATPSDNHEFITWSGDASGTANPITVTMDGDYQVAAHFEALPVEGQPPIEEVGVSVEGDGPYTVELHLAGTLADSCTRLDRVEQSRAGSDVEVEVITVRPGGVACAQRATPFSVDVTLDGTFTAGDYDLTCNGENSSFSVP